MLLLDHGSIPLTNLSPPAIQVIGAVGKWKLRRQLLVDLDSPSRPFVHPEIAILHLGASFEDFFRLSVEGRVLLDAEVIAHDIQSYVCHVAYGRNISWPMPCRLYAILLSQDR